MENWELSKLLDLLSRDSTNQGVKEKIKNIILDRFDEKPLIRYNRSLTHLEKEIPSKMLQDEAKTARLCALHIVDEFGDFDPINNINQIRLIVNTQIELAKEYPIQ